MRYFLPNKQEIDLDALGQAMLAGDGVRRFLDGETGNVIVAETRGDSTVSGVEPTYEYMPSRFFEVPKIETADRIVSMQEFIDVLVADEAPELAKKLVAALATGGDGVSQKFLNLLEQDPDSWIHGWAQWEGDRVFEEMEEWLASLPIEITEDPELDMDCLCCRGLMSSLLTGHGESEFQRMQKIHREAHSKTDL